MDLMIKATNATISSINGRLILVSTKGVEKSDVLEHLTVEDILEYFDVHKILDQIGETEVKDYFDLVNREI